SKSKTVELVQLWDFRQNRLVAEASLEEAVVDKRRALDFDIPRFVRFTADGVFVVVFLHNYLYVMSGIGLTNVILIPFPGPREQTFSFPGTSGVHVHVEKPVLGLFDISPTEHKVAIVWWTRNNSFAQVDVLDLNSGQQLRTWLPRDRGVGTCNPTAIAWNPKGTGLILAVPDTFPCTSSSNHADIFVADATSGAIRTKWKSGISVGDLAVTTDGRVWAVDSRNFGVVKNHDPKMRVFDLNTGKQLKDLPGRGSGVRYAVAASRS